MSIAHYRGVFELGKAGDPVENVKPEIISNAPLYVRRVARRAWALTLAGITNFARERNTDIFLSYDQSGARQYCRDSILT